MSQIEQEVVDTTEELETDTEETTEELEESTDDTPVEKPKESLESRHARLSRELKQTEKKLGINGSKAVEKVNVSKTGELDEAVRDFFDLKGYDDDEMDVFHNIMKRTGMSHREVLKDEYALSKVTSLRKEREVKEATPSGTRRAGGQSSNDVDYWVTKAEQNGELPKDYELRQKVIAKMTSKGDTSVPPWRR